MGTNLDEEITPDEEIDDFALDNIDVEDYTEDNYDGLYNDIEDKMS